MLFIISDAQTAITNCEIAGKRHNINANDNYITVVVALENLTKLDGLFLSINQLTTVAEIPALLNLTKLRLDNNAIDSLTNMATFPAINYITLRDNQLNAQAYLQLSQQIWVSKDDYVDVEGNPIDCNDPNAQTAVMNFENAGANLVGPCK